MGLLGGLVSTPMNVERLSIDCEHFPDAEQELTIEAEIDEIFGDRVRTSGCKICKWRSRRDCYRKLRDGGRFALRAWLKSPETR
ncbi:hypothetical protein [Rhodococcus koreensis]